MSTGDGARRLRRLARRSRVVGPAALGGVVAALSLPPFGWWPLGFAGAALLWWRLGGLSPARRLLAGWAFGLGLYMVGLWWLTAFNVYGGVLAMLFEALAPALAALASPNGRGRVPALAGAMVALEWARSSWPFGGLPLGGVALGQAAGPLSGAARLGGPLLLVGLVWLGGGGLGCIVAGVVRSVVARRRARREPAGWRALTGTAPPDGIVRVTPPGLRAPVLIGVLSLAVCVAVGAWGAAAADGGPARGTVTLTAVQGGGQRGLSKEQVDPSTVLDAQVDASRQLLAQGPLAQGRRHSSLVVWPEDVVALDTALRGSGAEATLASLARAARATLVAGVTEPAGPGRFRNEIVAWSPSGRIVDRFDKVHRVPFGEYVPLRGIVRHLADLSAVPEDAVAGHGTGVLRTPAGRLGTMVSYEVFFAERGRVATRAGARLLVVPTNTSSYSTSQVPSQEVAAARLQALSEGRDLVQVAPTGFSALVDHQGRVLARSSLGRRALLSGTLAMRSGDTVFERLGELGPLLLAGVAWGGGWLVGIGGPAPARPRLTRRRR